MEWRESNCPHLSACSASLALCTSSSFSVMSVPERWKLKLWCPAYYQSPALQVRREGDWGRGESM